MNQKYLLLESALRGLNNNLFNLLILKGNSGMGKTYNSVKFLKKKGVDFILINSYTTPLKFYQLLYENRNKKIIIFDDLEGITDNKIKGMLKSACWSISHNRTVSYYSTKLKDYPDSFELKTNIILICNDIPSGFKSIINRGELIEFNFNFPEKLEIFKSLIGEKIERKVYDYIKTNCSDATENLSIRTLEILSNYKRSREDWILHAKEMLKTNESLSLIVQGLNFKEWCDKTGLSRRTYFRYKKKIRGVTECQ